MLVITGSKMKQHKKNDTGAHTPVKSLSGIVLGPLFVVLLLVSAVAGSVYFFIEYGPVSNSATQTGSVNSEEKSAYAGPLVNIGDFIVNIISEEAAHYLKASITIEASDSERAEELRQRMPQIRDTVLMLTSNKTFEELYDMHGKKQLKAELLLEINALLSTEGATAIYFTEFVVQ